MSAVQQVCEPLPAVYSGGRGDGLHPPSPCSASAHADNGIGDHGGNAIRKALEVNAALTSLDLGGICCGCRDRDRPAGSLRWLVLGLKGMG